MGGGDEARPGGNSPAPASEETWAGPYAAPLAWRPRGASPGAARARRAVLAVPASNPRYVAKAAETTADAVLFDLEDSVAPARKAATRALVVAALNQTDFRGKLRVVRINDLSTPWAVRDVVELVEGAGACLDAIMLPKVNRPEDVYVLEVMLGSLEGQIGLTRRIGIEAQIETAQGMANVERIAQASPRLETLVFGPGDYAAYTDMPLLSIGAADADGIALPGAAVQPTASPAPGDAGYAGYPGHLWHYAVQRLVVAAKSAGLQAINGPYGRFRDLDGLRRAAALDCLLGMDGKWAVHPTQLPILHEVFTPGPAQVAQARTVLARYRQATETEGVGAVALGDEMIDEASRKLAEALLARARRGQPA
jgi:citrate lyase subunit beta/citryl-CoA lyase